MARKRQRSRHQAHSVKPQTPPPPSRIRWWAIRGLVAVGIPVGFLFLVECGLRWFHFGTPVGYFVRDVVQDRVVFHENPYFFLRFFGSEYFPRETQPIEVPVRKSGNSFRIFVLGASAAMGDPDQAYAFWRILEVMLRDRFPDLDIEIYNTAVASINSHVVLPIARECAAMDPDLYLLYLGNNEVVGPFGAGTILGQSTSSLALIRTALKLQELRLGQLMRRIVSLSKSQAEVPRAITMDLFQGHEVAVDSPALQKVYRSFRANLQDIAEVAERADADIVLSTVAANLQSFAPFASIPFESLSPARTTEWEEAIKTGSRAQALEKWEDALKAFQRAYGVYRGYAELSFRIGQGLWNLERFREATQAMAEARDLDGLRFRADSRINEIIRQIARKNQSRRAHLVDFEAHLREKRLEGVPDRYWFLEHAHFTVEGNYELAHSFYEVIVPIIQSRRGAKLERDDGPPRLAACERDLAYTALSRKEIDAMILERMDRPPYVSRYHHRAEFEDLRQRMAAIEVDTPLLKETINRMQEVLRKNPDDYWIRQRFGELLQITGQNEAALRVRQYQAQRFPYRFLPLTNLGVALDRAGRSREAIESYKKALAMAPFGDAYTHAELAYSLSQIGDRNAAIAHYRAALKINPALPMAIRNLGLLLNNDPEAAAELYQNALLAAPNLEDIYERLDHLLVRRANPQERIRIWQKIAQELRYYPRAFDRLGRALDAAGQMAEATKAYHQALALNPELHSRRARPDAHESPQPPPSPASQ